MNIQKLKEDIKNTSDFIPDQYDGSYELEKAIINEYAQEYALLNVDFNDLNAVYHMCIGTWKQSVEKKKASIDKTHLSLDSKERIKDLLDSIWAKTCRKEYINCSEDGSNPSIGMFGTGFYSFHNTSVSETRDFITMCIDILEMNDDEEIYKRADC